MAKYWLEGRAEGEGWRPCLVEEFAGHTRTLRGIRRKLAQGLAAANWPPWRHDQWHPLKRAITVALATKLDPDTPFDANSWEIEGLADD